MFIVIVLLVDVAYFGLGWLLGLCLLVGFCWLSGFELGLRGMCCCLSCVAAGSAFRCGCALVGVGCWVSCCLGLCCCLFTLFC